MIYKINATEKTWYMTEKIEAESKEEAIDIYERMLENGDVLVSDVSDLNVIVE